MLEAAARVKVRVEFAHLAPPGAALRFLLVFLRLGFGVWGLRLRIGVLGLKFRSQGSWFRVYALESGFKVQDVRFRDRVQGLGCKAFYLLRFRV